MRKTLILFVCALFILTGCSKDESPKEESHHHNQTDNQAVIWTVEPTLDYDYMVYPNTIWPTGYNQIYFFEELSGYPTFKGYTPNAIFAVKDGTYAIYDYEGNLLLENDQDNNLYGKYSPYTLGTIDCYTSKIGLLKNENYLKTLPQFQNLEDPSQYQFEEIEGDRIINAFLSDDYHSLVEPCIVGCGGIGYTSHDNVIINGELVNKLLIDFDANGNFRLANPESLNEENRSFYEDTKDNQIDNNSILTVVSPQGYYDSKYQKYLPQAIGMAHYNYVTEEINELEHTYVGNYINGFYAVTDAKPNSYNLNSFQFFNLPYESELKDYTVYEPKINEEVHYGFVEARTNELITDLIYDDLLYFSEGLAGVHKDGKWAFIDKTGQLVSEFLFDDITPVVNGKSYVKINGYYGILDLQTTLDKEIEINYANLNLDDSLQKDNFALPLGIIYCDVDTVRIRANHSTDSETVGKLGQLEDQTSALVYETYADQDYLWYRIGENQWVASSVIDNWYSQESSKKINLEYWNKWY